MMSWEQSMRFLQGLRAISPTLNTRFGARQLLAELVQSTGNRSSSINDRLGAVVEGLGNQSSLINEKLGALIEGLRNQSGLINDKLSALIDSQVAQLAVQRAQTEIIDRMMQSVGVDVRRLVDLAEIQARQVALQNRPK